MVGWLIHRTPPFFPLTLRERAEGHHPKNRQGDEWDRVQLIALLVPFDVALSPAKKREAMGLFLWYNKGNSLVYRKFWLHLQSLCAISVET